MSVGSRRYDRRQHGGHHGAHDDDLPGQVSDAAAAQRAVASGFTSALTRGQLLHLQRTAGNQAVQRLIGGKPVSVQRKPSLSGLKKAVGLGKKPGAAQAEKAGSKASDAKIVTTRDLEKQVSVLEGAAVKLGKGHVRGDADGQRAAAEVQAAAKKILGNLPDQDSKSSKTLGRQYPDAVRRLGRVIDETQLILDEVKVETTKAEAEKIYMESGQAAVANQKGGFSKLSGGAAFTSVGALEQPNDKVKKLMEKWGVTTYDEAFQHAVGKMAADPNGDDALTELRTAQHSLFTDRQKISAQKVAQDAGLSAAELAAIQVYTSEDYLYINPATANSPAWMKAVNQNKIDPSKTEQEEMAALRQEGGLHGTLALQALGKLPVFQGLGFRGESLDRKRFYSKFLLAGKSYRMRDTTITFPSITSISKSSKRARTFAAQTGVEYGVLYEFHLTNGRDIEVLSLNRPELEVAIFPGATFQVVSVEVLQAGDKDPKGWIAPLIKVTAEQVK